MSKSVTLNPRERVTILHALRVLQEQADTPQAEAIIASGQGCSQLAASCDHFEDCQMLTDKQIDRLCERLNDL